MSLRSRFILTLVLTFGLGIPGAKADSFSFSGNLYPSGSVSGTFSLDETTSTLSAFDLVAPGFEFTTTNSTGSVNFCNCYIPPGTQTTPVTDLDFRGTGANSGNELLLEFNTTVSGFDPSTFLTTGVVAVLGASGSESNVDTASSGFFAFTSGTGSTVATGPVPEPPSILLLLLGIGLVFFARVSCRSFWLSPPSPTGPGNS